MSIMINYGVEDIVGLTTELLQGYNFDFEGKTASNYIKIVLDNVR